MTQNPLRRLIECANALIDRLRVIADDPNYRAVWELHQIHNGPYTGPQYVGAFDALHDALASLPPVIAEGDVVMVPRVIIDAAAHSLNLAANGLMNCAAIDGDDIKEMRGLYETINILLDQQTGTQQ